MRTSTVFFASLLAATSLSLPLKAQEIVPPTADAFLQAGDAAPSPANETIAAVRVEGNQRVETRTILTYMALPEPATFDDDTINEALKNLYATDFFSDIQLLRAGDTLVVRVTENAIINRVTFEGNVDMKSEDLEKELELKPRSVYTKPKLQGDVKRILDIYRRSGRYTATVEPKLIQREQNRYDLVFEIAEGTVATIRTINFVGNQTFKSSELEEVIRSSESRWYQFLSDNDKYDPDRLLFDQELLRRFYTSQGHADFQVKSANVELSPNKDAFFVTYVLDEGPKYTLAGVAIDSTLSEREPLDLSSVTKTKANDVYNSTLVEESVDEITKELGNRGYAFVDIDPRITRNPENKTVDLRYVIKPGPRVYVERINITGNVRTLDEVIRREFRVSEGDPYNTAKLARTEQRLNNLNFFEKVNISNQAGSAPDRTTINVDVAEKSTGEINFGGGFSSTDGLLADFGVKENNFLGRGQEVRTRLTLANRRKQIELGFTEPYFLDRELSAGFDIFRTAFDYESESSYNLDSQGFTLRTGYAPQERWQHNISYMFRDNNITDVNPLASIYIREQEGRRRSSAVGQSFTYDNLNSRIEPSSGFFARMYQEFAGLGGQSKHIKHEGKVAYYYPLSKEWNWSTTGSVGHILGISGKNIPLSDRFFVGGDIVRGFANSGIGARDQATRDALGGNNFYAASTELKFPLGLPDDLGITGAVFGDIGNLWGVDSTGTTLVDSNALRASAGIGIGWKSPFGPIRIDIATPLLKEDVDETQTLRFSFGTRF